MLLAINKELFTYVWPVGGGKLFSQNCRKHLLFSFRVCFGGYLNFISQLEITRSEMAGVFLLYEIFSHLLLLSG